MSIDPAALMAAALKQTSTVREALELVERALALAGVPAPQAARAAPAPTPGTALMVLPQPARGPNTRWTPELVKKTETLLDNDVGLPEVARMIGCTDKAIRAALCRGTLKPSRFTLPISNRAAGLKAALSRGQKLRDYTEAERIIDAQDAPKVNGNPRL